MKFSLAVTQRGFAGQGKFSSMQIAAHILLAVALGIAPPIFAVEQISNPAAQDELEIGRRIYVDGILPSGVALTGLRYGTTRVSGAEAACVNCHRPSGMGQVEGDIQVPPISGNYLFARQADKHRALMDPRVSKALNQTHDPYTSASLTDAILLGKNIQGREMSVAMPRYELNESELRALTSYLKQLSLQWSPGASQFSIRFATVITPDVDPVRRKVVIDMMRSIIRQKNASTATAAKGNARRHMTSAAEFVLGTERTWELDVWELQGAPETWGEQLATHYRSQPVFALISGASTATWQPVHDFCDQEKVPCWFPSVDMPVKKPSRYSLYFSGGVLLEANVFASHVLDKQVLPKHLIQIYREEGAGRAAAQELARALEESSIKVENWALGADSAANDSLRSLLEKQKPGDVVVYWLRRDDIDLLAKLKPARGVQNYFSSRLANAEHIPLSAGWKANSHLIYLYELPVKREINLTYFHAWINMHQFPLIDEAMQSEVFFSLNYLTDTTAEMLDNLYRDYLLERAETMLDKREGVKSEQETRDRLFLGKPGDLVRKHGEMTAKEEVRVSISGQASAAISHGTTIYPHLSLGPGQRFSSKGGYIVRFADENSDTLIEESGWIVP
jgi:hypothetical protein